MEEKIYQLALYFSPGVGDVLFKQLISYSGSAEKVFNASRSKLLKIPGIGGKIAESIQYPTEYLHKAEEEFELISKAGGHILMYNDTAYPSRLREINDSPPIIFFKGNANLNNPKVISIVGTRNATTYGKEAVKEIIEGIKSHSPLIVSGLAYGIDVSAHRHALKCGLETVGVMGSGLDIIYPYQHKKVAHQMTELGGLITEHPMGTKPDAPHFPARNRIIAGMSDAVIVIEAAERGGALITAELANGYDREVFAIPGNLHSRFSEGCNKLIRNHKAHILTKPADIEYILNWPDIKDDKRANKEFDIAMLKDLNRTSQSIVSILSEKPNGLTLDELSWQAQVPVNEIASDLLNLEFKGILISLPGKKYKIRER